MSFHTAHNQAVTVEISQQSLACQCMMTVAATHAPQIYFFIFCDPFINYSRILHMPVCVCICVWEGHPCE